MNIIKNEAFAFLAHNLASPHTEKVRSTRTHVPAMGYISRTLLGSAEKIVHDPGAKGPSGEGEAAMTMICLSYFITAGILIYGALVP